MSDPQDALEFVLERLFRPHQHHRHCVHNMSAEEQKAEWRRSCDSDEMYDFVYGDAEPLVITPDDWEVDVPDLDFSKYEFVEGSDHE